MTFFWSRCLSWAREISVHVRQYQVPPLLVWWVFLISETPLVLKRTSQRDCKLLRERLWIKETYVCCCKIALPNCACIELLPCCMLWSTKRYSGWKSLLKHFTINKHIFNEGSVTGSTIRTKSPSTVSFLLTFCPSQSLKLGEDLGEGSSWVSTALIHYWTVIEKVTVFLGIGIKLLADNLVNLFSSILLSSKWRMVPVAIPSKEHAGECLKSICVVVNEDLGDLNLLKKLWFKMS